MRTRRARGQSLVELALVAPILIVLAMAVWDGGSVLREQVVLQQAARDGARVAATGYGTSVLDTVVADAVVASARDLPGVSSAISYPDPLSVQVRVTYTHSLITPVLRQVWAGGGTVNLQASATFYLPRLTPVPATLVLPTETPVPTLTGTPTATPTPVATSTATTVPAATVTPTPPPTATPTGTATLSPTATASATATQTRTSTPVPTATLSPTATPSATATQTQTSTPVPTATPSPTRTPTVTATPSPTRTSTPSPTSTASPTSTLTPTPTLTATPTPTQTITPTPALPCGSGLKTFPAFTANSGYWCTVTVTSSSRISAGWADNNDSRNQILIVAGSPGSTSGNLATDTRILGVLVAVTSAPPAAAACQNPGLYSVYFFDGGVDIPSGSTGLVTLLACNPGNAGDQGNQDGQGNQSGGG